jgi:lysyl-tRNA synthetase class 2
VRAWFDEQGFLSVETPARVPAPGQEIHLDAFAAGGGRFLVTSPEYHMKRLLGAGYERIVQIGKAWRAGEAGPHHQPEFLIAEWYRAGAPLSTIADDCEALLRAAGWQGPGPFERTTVREVMRAHAGIDLRGDETAAGLATKVRAAGVQLGSATAWDDVFFQAWLDRVEPRIGRERPTFVFDWPAPLGALARRKADDPSLVERFELYANGLELANAFGELTDPEEQRARFAAESETRARLGKTVYPPDERLLSALPHIGAASGVALGLDRVVMLVLGVDDIREVVAFADDET